MEYHKLLTVKIPVSDEDADVGGEDHEGDDTAGQDTGGEIVLYVEDTAQ